ncbi:MAG: hypothetical protein COA65_01940 [Rhodospirillaceae bacterium]|nr:MAG: hypothetical protein COA65_01940 [Rhodospirillaceae bacterium]
MPMVLFGNSPDSLFFLLIALAVNALFGGRWFSFLRSFHPEVLFGRLADGFDRRLNRAKRSERNRILRGGLVVFVLGGLAVVLGVVLLDFAARAAFGRSIEILLLAVLIPLRPVFDEGRSLARALKGERFLPAAFPFLAGVTKGDRHRYARLGIENLAMRFGKDVVAPIFWFILLGLPGVFLARAARVLGQRLGDGSARHLAFGFVPRRFDAALCLIPVRLAGLFLVAAAIFTPRAKPVQGFRVLKGEGGGAFDLHAGWPVAAMAGALDLALGGPGSGKEGRPGASWVGSGRARAGVLDLHQALYLFAVAAFLLFGLMAALAIAV